MDLKLELEQRKKFLEFLEINGLNPKQDKRILELAPDINLSISKLLAEKYGKLYKTFLISQKFKYDNIYNIKGVRGDATCFLDGLSYDIPKTSLNDKNIPRRLFTGEYKLPKEESFDTLLIYGLRKKMNEFDHSKIKRRFLGEIYKGSPLHLNINDIYYSSIMSYLKYAHFGEYKFIEEYDSKKDETYLLIKKK